MKESPKFSVSVISHELRNPLTLIHSTLQLIGGRYPEVQQDPLWEQVMLDLNYMSKLLSELSSLNSSQSLNYSQVNIRQILTNVVRAFSSEAQLQEKNISLNFETSLQWIQGDSLKIQEVLRNLLQNAMDATQSKDYIDITVQSKWKRLIIIIRDSGCGMDRERLSTIFEPFVTYKTNGTGLGLTIVKNIVDAHHGVIQVHSKPMIGTKIVLFLPIHSENKSIEKAAYNV